MGDEESRVGGFHMKLPKFKALSGQYRGDSAQEGYGWHVIGISCARGTGNTEWFIDRFRLSSFLTLTQLVMIVHYSIHLL